MIRSASKILSRALPAKGASLLVALVILFGTTLVRRMETASCRRRTRDASWCVAWGSRPGL